VLFIRQLPAVVEDSELTWHMCTRAVQWIFWVGPLIGATVAALYHKLVLRGEAARSRWFAWTRLAASACSSSNWFLYLPNSLSSSSIYATRSLHEQYVCTLVRAIFFYLELRGSSMYINSRVRQWEKKLLNIHKNKKKMLHVYLYFTISLKF